MPRQVLLLCYYFPPAPLAYAQRVAKFCKYLPRETDWVPQVICGELPPDLMANADETMLAEIPDIVGIERVGSFWASDLARRLRAWQLLKPVALWRKLRILPDIHGDWIPGAVAAAERKFPRGQGISAILASGPPNSVYVAGEQLSQNWQVPLVLDMRDPWYAFWGKRSWLHHWHSRQLKAMENKVYKQASVIITNTAGNMLAMKQHFPDYADKIRMIPNGFDPEDIDWTIGPQLHEPAESAATLHILYLGGVRGEGFEEPLFRMLASFFRAYPKERDHIKVHFVGGTQSQVDQAVRPLDLANICQGHGIVPANAVGRPLAEADIYVVMLPAAAHRGWVPAKLYYYLAGGKYIFAMVPDGATKALLGELGDQAEIVDPGNLEAAQEAFARLVKRARRVRRTTPEKAFPLPAQPYTRGAIARAVGDVLCTVAGPLG